MRGKLRQTGEERKSLRRLKWCGFAAFGLVVGICRFRLGRPMLFQLSYARRNLLDY